MCFPFVVRGQTAYVSNQDVILNLIVAQLERELPDTVHADTVAIRLPEATDQSLQAFQNALFNSGLMISSNYTNSKTIAFTFDINNTLQRVSKSLYTRKIKGSVGININSNEGILIWSTRVNIEYEDSVGRDAIDSLQTDWIPSQFDKIEHRRKGMKFLKLVEPILISSAVITTAFLLYNIRSN